MSGSIPKRQHYVARFYLRNFAEPMFSENLYVFDLQKRRWERRTPDGVGWFRHLCSMVDEAGVRSDDFDRFLKENVEDPALPAIRALATAATLDGCDRRAVALFVSLTIARSPAMMHGAVDSHVGKLPEPDRAELEQTVKAWCQTTKQPYGSKAISEFLKPSSFGATWVWSTGLAKRLLQSDWNLVKTGRDQPFVTSDWPMFAQEDEQSGLRLVTFPLSSERALVITSGGSFNTNRDLTQEAAVMNRQSTCKATKFVVCCKESFVGDEFVNRQISDA